MVTANRIKEELDRAESSSRTEWKGEEEGKAKGKKLPEYITFSELRWIFINGGRRFLVCVSVWLGHGIYNSRCGLQFKILKHRSDDLKTFF